MVKILVLCLLYFSTLCSARYTTSTSTQSPIIDPLNPYDATGILQRTIAQILNDYRSSYQEWKHNDAIIDAIRENILNTFSQRSQKSNYNFDFGKVSITRVQKTSDYDTKRREIACTFGDNLKMQMPMYGFKFEGNFNVTSNTSSTPLSYEYEVTLKGLYFSFVLHSNFNLTDEVPNNQTEIDISYKRVNIDLDTPDNGDQLTAVTELDTLLKTIKSSLRATVHRNLMSLLREKPTLPAIYLQCMQPKRPIISAYADQILAVAEYERYYLIKEQATDSWDSVNLKCTPIQLKGLCNFDSLSFKGVDYTDVSYMLKFDNLEGEVNCSYSLDGKDSIKPYEFKFKADAMTMSGTMNRDGGYLRNMIVDFDPLLEDAESSDAWASLSKIIVLGRLKKIIGNSLATSLMNKYRNL